VGVGFIASYALAYAGTCLLFLAPLLVSLALKVNSLVGLAQAPAALALVAGVGAALAVVTNPFFGKLSDRTSSTWGMRRPWITAGVAGGALGTLVVALAPNIPLVLIGWCTAQVCFNALLAAMAAVLPDQVPTEQRGLVAGILGTCLPVASVAATFLVKLFADHEVAMFVVPCAIGSALVLPFAITLHDRRLDPQTDQPGPCARWPPRSGSARGRAPTSRGHSPAGSCSSWRTPSSLRTRRTTC
jgi:MFS family permease